MTNFIPIFPIDSVVYPDEIYKLHISDDNYKHLITDCYGENKAFGIIPIVQNKLSEIGTLVEIIEVSEVWKDGRMNILVKGGALFKTLEIIQKIPEKLYSGAIVSYLENQLFASPSLTTKIIHSLKEFHHLINFPTTFDTENTEVNSYQMAHIAGLSLAEEYELLCLLFESQRLEYLRRHLNKTLPLLINIQMMLRKQAQKNDFKNHKGFDFDINL